ncbi:putative E3 ubiquitin-protein ligase rf4 [Phtheirospermum japonicum]|uniref:Putative E3 ubiquitin-protein ligase rf4 n=1 Tax=Phtheirospermum japonicum TaxID=374723 RepID=A0A830BDK2_9LAMI|nr:putative E3 ubiquitin-protein ligase rf4 [Phtheirospermum japonicum]
MGADDSSEGQSVNEKGRNKRKCVSESTPISLTEFPRYEMLEQGFQNAFKQLGSMTEKPKDTNIKNHESGEKEKEKDDGPDPNPEWDDPITRQLEDILSSTLSSTFSDAVKKLIESGHTQPVAEWAICHSSLYNGNKDAVSNVVDGALALLKLDEHVEMPKHPVFDGLQSLVEYTLLEMIHTVREVRPGLTVTEAMWCLLLSELNLAGACGLKKAPSEASGENPANSEPEKSEDSENLGNLKPGDPRSQIFRPETPVDGPAQQVADKKPSPVELGKESSSSLSLQELKVRFSGVDMDEKAMVGPSKKAGPPSSAINFKRDLLRQKAIHFEKNYRGRLTKGAFKAKVAAWGSMVLDKSLKAQSGSISVSGPGLGPSSVVINEQNDNQSVQDPVFALPAVNNSNSTAQKVEIKDPTDYYAKIPFDSILQRYVAVDEKDKALLMLVPLKALLERELGGWTDWANEKIMQAAQKLGKDQRELKQLRQEREEIEKSRKEKQGNDESNLKRLNEMEHALGNANGQIELAKCTIHRLEFENSVVKKEMEKAKMEACGSAVKLQEAMVREYEAVKKAKAWEEEKGLVQQRLTSLRRKIVEVEKQLGKAKNRLNQFKALLKQEQKEKLNAEKQYGLLRAKIEAEDALMQVEADNINQTGQKNKQKCEDDIKNLETMISELKLESDKIKIAALNAGYGPNVGKQQVPKVAKRLAVFQDIFNGEHVKPERECVMCMTEEISVVFIPCAHQVLCGPCNILHEKQGMSDCPSCRATIDERVVVVYRPN